MFILLSSGHWVSNFSNLIFLHMSHSNLFSFFLSNHKLGWHERIPSCYLGEGADHHLFTHIQLDPISFHISFCIFYSNVYSEGHLQLLSLHCTSVLLLDIEQGNPGYISIYPGFPFANGSLLIVLVENGRCQSHNGVSLLAVCKLEVYQM